MKKEDEEIETNITGEKIGKLYYRRWNIELVYDIAKNK